MEETVSKLVLDEKRLQLASDQVDRVLTGIFTAVGFPENTADSISSHLIDANLVGVESHGIMRVLEYVDEVKSGVLNASSRPELVRNNKNFLEINGNGGIGISALNLAYDECCKDAEDKGLSVMAIKNVGHTGRLGAYAEVAGESGFLTICMGGGNPVSYTHLTLPTSPKV